MLSTRRVLFLQHCKSPMLFSLSLLTPFQTHFFISIPLSPGLCVPFRLLFCSKSAPLVGPGDSLSHALSNCPLRLWAFVRAQATNTSPTAAPPASFSDSMEGKQFKKPWKWNTTHTQCTMLAPSIGYLSGPAVCPWSAASPLPLGGVPDLPCCVLGPH